MYFFENDIPKTIHSINKISTTNQHYKDGSHSLQWQFDTKSQLTFTQPIIFEPQDRNEAAPYTFIAWVYNDEPLEESATFQFGTDDRIDAQFSYSLNFQGWRGISVPYRDMDGKAVSGMNKLSIIVPDGIAGKLIFD
ncbi:MAG: chondroitinase family protein [Vibrio hibernica]